MGLVVDLFVDDGCVGIVVGVVVWFCVWLFRLECILDGCCGCDVDVFGNFLFELVYGVWCVMLVYCVFVVVWLVFCEVWWCIDVGCCVWCIWWSV